MPIRIARPLKPPVFLFLSAFVVFPQSDVALWSGELHSEAPRLYDGYTIELIGQLHNHAGRTDIRSDGSFEFTHAPEGLYEADVSDGRGRIVFHDYVRVANGSSNVELRLPPDSAGRPPSGGVSVKQLLHPPTPKAIAWAKAAEKSASSGQYAKAAVELESAVRISPDYVEARTNLSAQYLRLGRYQDALLQAQRAVDIQPSLPAITNLAYAHLMLGQNAAAEAAARTALRMDSGSPVAHYILGLSLAMQGSKAEALRHLEKAAEALPSARENLAKVRAQ